MSHSFRALWFSSAASELGGAFFTLCNSVLIYQLTGSASALGIVWLIYYVPSFFMQLFIGPYIDRWSRKKTMIVCQCIRAVPPLVIMAALFGGSLNVLVIYLFQIVIGVVMPIFTPANQAILPAVMKTEELSKANASLDGVRQVMAVLGPVLAGIFVEWIEVHWLLFIVAAAFAGSAYSLTYIREPKAPVSERKPWAADFKEGFQAYASHPFLVWMGVFFGFVQFGVGMTLVTNLPYITSVLDQPYASYGVFMAGFPVGYTIGAFLSPRLKMNRGLGILFGALFIGGVTYLSLALTPWYLLALVTEGIAGIVIAIFNIHNITLIQQSIPQHLMGKVTSIRLLIMRVMLPLGIVTASAGVQYVSIQSLYFLNGSVICIASFIGYIFLRTKKDLWAAERV